MQLVPGLTLFVAVKVSVFGQMVTVPVEEFGLFVTIGFGLWSFISGMLLDGCAAFIHSRHWILGSATPYPVFILHLVLLPMNVWRTFEMISLVRRVEAAAKGNLAVDWLKPFMKEERHRAGHILFRRGDDADRERRRRRDLPGGAIAVRGHGAGAGVRRVIAAASSRSR